MKSASEADTVYNYTGKYQVVEKDVKGKKNTYYQLSWVRTTRPTSS